MIYVYGGVRVDPARKAEVTAVAAEFARTCREEAGCVEYNLSWNTEDENFLRLIEVWEPTSALDAHVAQPHVKDWTAFVQSAAVAPPAFTKYTVDVVA
jgi:quinol monooxygenase YgiN